MGVLKDPPYAHQTPVKKSALPFLKCLYFYVFVSSTNNKLTKI